jgi:hypothetical protein
MHQTNLDELPTWLKVVGVFASIAVTCIVLVAFIPNW